MWGSTPQPPAKISMLYVCSSQGVEPRNIPQRKLPVFEGRLKQQSYPTCEKQCLSHVASDCRFSLHAKIFGDSTKSRYAVRCICSLWVQRELKRLDALTGQKDSTYFVVFNNVYNDVYKVENQIADSRLGWLLRPRTNRKLSCTLLVFYCKKQLTAKSKDSQSVV